MDARGHRPRKHSRSEGAIPDPPTRMSRPTKVSDKGAATLAAILTALPQRQRQALLADLKVFYLVSSLYLAHQAGSLHEARDRLVQDHWVDIAREDLPVSVRSLSRIITGLEPLFATVLGIPGLKLLVKRERRPTRLTPEAERAWRETEVCLRGLLSAGWFGFPRPSPTP